VPQRPTSWQTFLRAHWGEIAGADFFTTEVWTWRGLVTCAVIGWMIARLHRNYHPAMLILSAMSPIPWASWWGWNTWRLLQAGLWPFWDFRFALLFHAAALFIGFPTCILLGGLWGASKDNGNVRMPHDSLARERT
jgi:hypothetical protein